MPLPVSNNLQGGHRPGGYYEGGAGGGLSKLNVKRTYHQYATGMP